MFAWDLLVFLFTGVASYSEGSMASNMTIILPPNIALYKLQCYSAVPVTVQMLSGFAKYKHDTIHFWKA